MRDDYRRTRRNRELPEESEDLKGEDLVLDMTKATTLPRTIQRSRVRLDPEQRAAVKCKESCYVVGPPGSGKTEVFERKAETWTKSSAWLPFTKAARKELVDRLPSKVLEEFGVNEEEILKVPLCQAVIATVHAYCQAKLGTWPGSYQAQLTEFLKIKNKETYALVGADEAQDFRPLHWEVIKSIMDKNSVFFGGVDPFQTIFLFGDAMGESIIKEFQDRNYKEFPLHNSWRASPKIAKLLNFLYPREVVGKGPKTYGKVAVFARTHSQLDVASDQLKEAGIHHQRRKKSGEDTTVLGASKIHLMVTHACKGLGYDEVYQIDWPEPMKYSEIIPETNLLYVSIARASKKFYLVEGCGETFAEPRLANSGCKFLTMDEMVRRLKDYA